MHHPLNIRPYRVPVVLTVPGLDNSGPGHWQTIWEQQRHDTHRVDLGMWSRPHRNSWVTRLGQAIRTAQTPIVLYAHSLGCLAIAWWTILEGQAFGHPIAGALFVAPPDCDHPDAADRLAGFGPTPRKSLPFPSLLVASRNDPYASSEWSESLARDWGSEFVDAGALGHINAASSIGDWPDGQALLERLVATAAERARDPAPLETRRSIVDRPDARPRPTLLR